jgi:predicted GIY-YIG superfamily endonuclease
MTKIKVDYNTENSVIYRIQCIDSSNNFVYVGSTTNFTQRKALHKSDCNNENSKAYNLNTYKIIRQNGGWTEWEMKVIEVFPCESKQHLCVREQYHIDKNRDTINSQRAHVENPREAKIEYDRVYRDIYREARIEYNRVYRDIHREAINAKHNCPCGGTYTHRNKQQHANTQKHRMYLATLIEENGKL